MGTLQIKTVSQAEVGMVSNASEKSEAESEWQNHAGVLHSVFLFAKSPSLTCD